MLKSHLPADAVVPLASHARYLFVGRNGKDIGLSFHNYLAHFSPEVMATIARIHTDWSGDPTSLVIPESKREFFDRWLDTDGYDCCDLLDIMRSWWKVRHEPNVLLVHYAELERDLPAPGVRSFGSRGSSAPIQNSSGWSSSSSIVPSSTCEPARTSSRHSEAHDGASGVLPEGRTSRFSHGAHA
ncbi:MAG TPA: sulfotransferase domain-containing protein [Labilithrix sp.]|nr:sulfotransferase domain-containing protein [Labilithrix sp.]